MDRFERESWEKTAKFRAMKNPMHRFGAGALALALTLAPFVASAQVKPKIQSTVPSDTAINLDYRWWHADIELNRVLGISAQRAYDYLIGDKPRQEVVVAVIDGGVDVLHEDLATNIWVNSDEIPGNGIDDDANGYVDDVHGWSFISGPGGEVNWDNLEFVRALHKMEQEVAAGTRSAKDPEYKNLQTRMKNQTAEWTKRTANAKVYYDAVMALKKFAGEGEVITPEVLEGYTPADKTEDAVKKYFLRKLNASVPFDEAAAPILEDYYSAEGYVKYCLDPLFDGRSAVGDDYNDLTNRIYGDHRVIGPRAEHGTHVAGIIAAVRGNGVGMDGIADNAKIMVLRVVPKGDERDKDVANAIRYAVDNGAKVINMSFGKSISDQQEYVAEAVRYAAEHDVLLVHAAGNDSKNLDVSSDNYPTPIDPRDGSRYPHWIEVGASSFKAPVAAEFSNYGATRVDLFAPGDDIYSTVPGSKYETNDGTSMAAPVVAGVAAVLRGQYPELSAVQIRKLIMSTALAADFTTTLPGKPKKKATFKSLSVTGGIVNMYRAVNSMELRKAAPSKN